MSFWIVFQGFSLGASMIIPIGAQNAYVLNQGIKRNHHLMTAATCSLIDILLISLGVFGGGSLFSQNETLLNIATIGGILFLTFYSYLSVKSALQFKTEAIDVNLSIKSRHAVIIGVLAVSLLNPHVYLDTIVVLGSIGGQFTGLERLSFALGTMIASLVWFFGLSIAASKLANTLSKPKVKIAIDLAVALVMMLIAISLTIELFN
ncbi:LysE/ArgO family amino acid transporter [Vibrio sp. TH_r3]|uniref:LysE/ArgO family amino acid transporter n=1 Tax=Vibrio sp. TH_r3 TaxID=3082084 RepID=UPI00295345D0|nr:LysE/ArgO family amino acid transporter [Vibrio sp. TH_r3]MDV7106259.1 LysE/ArgO family amino acid transporter [Vibrio sp. TH_r3]